LEKVKEKMKVELQDIKIKKNEVREIKMSTVEQKQ